MVHVERVLFVIGDQNTGKSVQLRSMFLDWRLGRKGEIPGSKNLPNAYPLSNERWLYLRLTSPHEANETLKEFLEKCEYEMQPYQATARRWNLAGALQPNAANNMPDAVATISAFVTRFEPERVRAVIFHPDKNGASIPHQDLLTLYGGLQGIPQTEVILTDARNRTGNGLTYADFFDFT